MTSTEPYQPRPAHRVMVSSTFTDLKGHREALDKALHAHDLFPCVMENDSARLDNVLESSLEKVRDSAAYIGVISLVKYGQIPMDEIRNPQKLSLTELEFNEAERLKRPILLFFMGDDHPVKKADVERDSKKEKKLAAFRERAKQSATPGVQRVYAVFESLEDFKSKIAPSLNKLCEHLAQADTSLPPSIQAKTTANSIPRPPAFHASPDYIGRHEFIGRKAQLQTLSDWAQPTDPTSVLLFEAIGGNGKSMLTWEWAKDEKGKYATQVRDWAGRFWYSFYEKGAVMRKFCQQALAYMTEQPLENFEKKPMDVLRRDLIAELHRRPWLLVLDGLERVLVAYHRIDAAEVRDEEVNRPTDKVLDRNPCDAIRDEDTELLRALAGAAPSKILISSRLVPRALLNRSGLPLPGVKPLVLPGLDEADAEQLLGACCVYGTSADIRYYLTTYCGNHPLVIGVLAGLINSFGPHRGDFDGWAADPAYGAGLNLANLDLIQSRNHILRAALDALEPTSRQLLSMLALVSGAVDYETVAAFNPHRPPEPVEVEVPTPVEQSRHWARMNEEQRIEARRRYSEALAQRKEYEAALLAWRESPAVREAPGKLAETIEDLEQRGLLQYDRRTKRYDLHPVVRGVAAGGMPDGDKERYGQQVVDYYASRPHDPYETATTIEDVEDGLHVVRTLLKLGYFSQAVDALYEGLLQALLFNLEAYTDIVALLRPFFPAGWGQLPTSVDTTTASRLAGEAGFALDYCGEFQQALRAYGAALRVSLDAESWSGASTYLGNISRNLTDRIQFAPSLRVNGLALDLATVVGNNEEIFTGRLFLFADQTHMGLWADAEATWALLDPMGRAWSRLKYRQGRAEYYFARAQFWQGNLRDEHLDAAARLAEQDGNRTTLRDLHGLRGLWQFEHGEWQLAANSFVQAVTMARERKLVDGESEAGLALAKWHLGQFNAEDARGEAERLARMRDPAHRPIARLWQAIGDSDHARMHALMAYEWAWADGEPYVHRYELTRSTELLQELGVPIPQLPPYAPARDELFPWEADVRAAIEKLKLENEAKKSTKKS
jgi:tetratricopeptide (TPR) repeat protein